VRRLSILYVAYPLLKVSDESAGGAEQMLLTLEREMAAAGHRTTVAACDGSRVCGRLLATGAAATAPDHYARREQEQSARILQFLRDHPGEFDLIHDKSGSFFRHAGECPAPVLATLHLPRAFYPEEFFSDFPRNLWFNCVSHSQARTFADLPNMIGVVQNGIAVERYLLLPGAYSKSFRSGSTPLPQRLKPGLCAARDGAAEAAPLHQGDYLLWLGRICEEKAPHLAIAVAQQAGVPLVITGQVYPFRYHQAYFEREIRPWISGGVRFVESPSFADKVKLLREARAVLLTSTAEETSSLVAMEAMACGTPVIAVRCGAFAEIVADGETGFIVETVEEMALALEDVERISPKACRTRVEQQFSAGRMAQEYEGLYRRVLTAAKELAA